MASAHDALARLVPAGSGTAVDVGCRTGLAASTLTALGYRVAGVDYSGDQLRVARSRLPVVRGDGRRLPLASRSVPVVVSVLTHTDLSGFARLVGECVRVLAPGGVLVYVGVHPCFVHPFAEHLADGLRIHPGYRRGGWQPATAFTGSAVRQRVGVHHLPLGELLSAMVHPDAPLDRVLEAGGGQVPELLCVRLRRAVRP
jgi:SAM-dependent methyltransferase